MAFRFFGFDTKCAMWNVELPHPHRTSRSDDFSLDGSDWFLRMTCCLKESYFGTESWRLSLVSCAKENPGKYVIVPYIEVKSRTYYRLANSLELVDIQRNDLTIKYGIIGDTVKMLFLFTPDILITSEDNSSRKRQRDWKTSDSEDVFNQSLSFENLSKDMIQLFNNEEHSDVVLKCGESRFSVHKNVLSTRSEVFAAMFRQDMSENRSGVVDIVDVEGSVLDQFVQYLYSGRLEEMTMDKAIELYQVADKYAVHSLKLFCTSFMSDNLSREDVCRVLILADQVGDSKLSEAAACFAANAEGFLRTQEWKNFATTYPSIGTGVFFKYVNNA